MAKTCGACEKSAYDGGRDFRCSVTGQIHRDDHTCDVEDVPRLCQVLGVAVGERFNVRDDLLERTLGPFCVSGDGNLITPGGKVEQPYVAHALIEAINRPGSIERLPRLTPEEVQRCRDFGAKWVSRDADSYQVYLWETEPEPQPGGVWAGGKSCAQAWARFFPSVQPGQLVPVEGVS